MQFNIVENKDLKKYTWFKTGGNAEFFFQPKSKKELQTFLKENKKAITIIGGGSNLLIRDKGIKGVTILLKNTLSDIKLKNGVITAGCGALNSKIYNFCKANGIGGYEFLGTIPGTLGGAIRGNAGAFGSEIKDFVIDVDCFTFNGEKKTFTNEQCNFEYRQNNLENNLIFIEARLKADLKTTKEQMEVKFNEYMQKRKNSQPIGERTAGSTFKNPSAEMPAWKVVQELGYQNKDFGGAKMSEKHANFLINTGNATAKSIEGLIDNIIKDAKEKMNLKMELEIKIVGQ